MQVETFETTEESAGGSESLADPAALKIIEGLNLRGQKKFIRTTDEATSRIPYRLLTITEYRVYTILLPNRAKLEEYDGQMIPSRVLTVANHAQSLNFFKRLEVWHQEGKDDPLLVGSTADHDWGRPDQRHAFLLARWGNELKPLEEMLLEAKRVIASTIADGARTAKLQAEMILGNIDETAEAFLRLGKVPPQIYFNLS